MPAYGYLDETLLGLMTGIEGLTDFVETVECMEANGLAYGYPIFAYAGNLGLGWGAHTDTATITASGSFTGSDTAIIVTLNGVALSSIGYASSSLATGNAVAAAILAALIITNPRATVAFNDSAHTFTIISPGIDVTATLASSGGVTATTAYTSSAIFMGIAGFTQQSLRDTAGGYRQNQAMNSAFFGFIYVQTSVAVNDGQPAFVIYAPGATQGQFTNVPTNNMPTHAIFRTTLTGAGIAKLELRGKANLAGTI